MKKILFILTAAFLFNFTFISCGSTENIVPQPEPAAEPQPEPQEVPPVPSAEDSEYARSIGEITISKNEFAEDKAAIQAIIKELDVIMKNLDYKKWVTYVDQESISYWSKPVNLKKASSKLPKKGLLLRNLEDYFRFVFVPSRSGRDVPEIRYATNTYVKAVQFQDDTDIIYYHFNKIDGQWMVHLPPLD